MIHFYCWVASFLIHFSLPVDQIGGDIDQIQDTIDWLVPVLQHILLVLDGFEVDHAVDPVDPAGNHVLVVQSADLLFAVFSFHLQKLAYSTQCQLSVVFTDGSDVVLHQHSLQLLEMALNYNQSTRELAKEGLNSSNESGLYSCTSQLTISSSRNLLMMFNNSGSFSSSSFSERVVSSLWFASE